MSPARGRSRSRSPRSNTAQSPAAIRERSPPRRSISPRSASRSRSPSRARSTRRHNEASRNAGRNGRSRTRSLSRSLSRGRSYSRSMSRGSPMPKSSKVSPSLATNGRKLTLQIVVEKLTKNVNESHLSEIFGAYGSIKDLDLPMNKQCKLPNPIVDRHVLTAPVATNRGTAYILYTNTADAEAAIAHMHEAQLDGAVISVSIVLPRRKFSRSPPPTRRGAPSFDRYENRGPAPGPYRGDPPPSAYGGRPPGRYRSPPPPLRRASPPPRYGRRPDPRDRDLDTYRPRSYSRSRSRSYSSRSRSFSPPRGGRGYRSRETPPPPSRGRRRRSPSYSSYSSYSDRSRSRDRGRARYGRDR